MPEIIESIAQWRVLRKQFFSERTVGFVPTMGNLHAGHASLLQRCRTENDLSILSIFVNPTQFNDQQDFQRYPKTIEQDIALAESCGVDYILLPQNEEIYPDQYTFKITENKLSQVLEGKHRPGHFDGVLTVVMKLFSLIRPTRAYFGEKDYQQLCLIEALVEAFFLDIEIIRCPTIREKNQLAFSSRNNLFNDVEREQASFFALQLDPALSDETIKTHLEKAGFRVEYIERWQNRLLGAVKFKGVRLIDNVPISIDIL